MSVTFTRAAWLGLRRFLDDPIVRLQVDTLLALSRPLTGPPPCSLSTEIGPDALDQVVAAYGRWARSKRLTGS